MTLPVVFTKRADRDIDSIYAYIVHQASTTTATRFVEALLLRCLQLGSTPYIGRARPELRPGTRVIGFRNAVTIYFSSNGRSVRVLKLAYRGRRIELA